MRIPYRGAGIALFYSDSEDYILLGLRSDYPFHNRWSVPGGYYEKSKDTNDKGNAIREFSEETGIDFNKLKCKYITKWSISAPLFNWTTYIYKTSVKIECFKPDEFYEVRWINVKDLNQYKLRPFTKKEIMTFYKDHR